jgi:hypothetical protein
MPVRDLSKAPTVRGAMIRPNSKTGSVAPIVAPVQGYLNLLAAKFDRLGIPVRIVMPQFYPVILRQGWAGVQRWLKETAFMESNWLTAQIILVPIFTGPIYSGHWPGLLLTAEFQLDRLESESTKTVYFHKLPQIF